MQKAILVGVNLNENLDFDHSMEELENLAEACEIEAAAQVVQNLPMVNNAFYIGTGKVEEVKNLVSMLDADCVIFDNSLTPVSYTHLGCARQTVRAYNRISYRQPDASCRQAFAAKRRVPLGGGMQQWCF